LLFFIPAGGSVARELVDQAGRQVEVPDKLSRVVALAPSITEIVYELGREQLLVGATHYSNTPAAARALPRVGSYVRLDVEKIVALKPDICLGIKDGNPAHTVEKVETLGIPVYVIDPKNLDDIIDVVRRFGDLLAVPETSENLIRIMRSRIDRVAETVARAQGSPGVFFQIDAAPIITIGTNTFIHELITLAGGRNLAAGPQDYPRYNWEEVLVLQPEVAIVASMAGGHSPQELLAGWRRWPQIPAVKNNRIHVVDANLIDRPTPRLIDGLELFVRIIHPELFGELHAD
jgi:iron complex transport system substrate-binding protein